MREEIIEAVLVDVASQRINMAPEKQVLISQWGNLSDRNVDMGRGWSMRSSMYIKKKLDNGKKRLERMMGRKIKQLDPISEDEGLVTASRDEDDEDDEPPKDKKKVIKKGILIGKNKKPAEEKKKERGFVKKMAATVLPVVVVVLLGCFLVAFVVGLMMFAFKMYRDATRTFAAVGALAALGASVATLTEDVGSPGWISSAGTVVKGVFKSAWNSGN